ncbi:hypothetical protein SARC_05550 [Sphaeroforma arctica JP610]|uniref:Ubiquitin-like-conjugating enzyme ATG10 n=1 Tax=Sphaeroforma arctica JP610 TaxID=667725 RepID=A0A0L0FZZ8_9EUKA|nr:hypothetical protein SARC_05550 [Sphaeroforma arctica JP610]KNC82169.1 hypothetical protein SARC_05550 [Sphaeroforma arctica JP610]|eukprot:XP_014156071.1 hypothetical protein SARC_05550 [Sphaeroforma arctica JP610]
MPLSWPDFVADAVCFVERSDKINDGWELIFNHGCEGGRFIKKNTRYRVASGSIKKTTSREASDEQSDDTDSELSASELELTDESDYGIIDDNDEFAVMPQSAKNTWFDMEYHIVYSLSFKVPVLYLTGRKKDGKLLRSDDILGCLPAYQVATFRNLSTPVVTQVEHPLLGVPYLMVHPCRTEDLMQIVLSAKSEFTDRVVSRTRSDIYQASRTCIENNAASSGHNYIVSWLTLVGPIFGLKVATKYLNY